MLLNSSLVIRGAALKTAAKGVSLSSGAEVTGWITKDVRLQCDGDGQKNLAQTASSEQVWQDYADSKSLFQVTMFWLIIGLGLSRGLGFMQLWRPYGGEPRVSHSNRMGTSGKSLHELPATSECGSCMLTLSSNQGGSKE